MLLEQDINVKTSFNNQIFERNVQIVNHLFIQTFEIFSFRFFL